jgi:hypothetical protein
MRANRPLVPSTRPGPCCTAEVLSTGEGTSSPPLSQPASATPHARWAPTPAPPSGMRQRGGAGLWVMWASRPKQRRGRQGVEPGSPDPLGGGSRPAGRTVRGEIPGRRGIRPGGGANLLAAGAPSAATGLRWTGDSAGPPGDREAPPQRRVLLPTALTSTRAGSATAAGGPTLSCRPGPRAGR